MPYRAPVSEFEFIYANIVGLDQVQQTSRFAEADPDTVTAVLTEAGRLCEDVLAPVNRNGDLTPSVLENGALRSAPGYAQAFAAIAEGGWVGVGADPEHGGMGLPLSVATAVGEMMASGCLALQLNPLLTQGNIEALEVHASDDIKALYLPKLNSGEWSGTMNLTEPQAGSDVGALRTKAERNPDGTYAITGQKIFITWGDCDFTENVCHLVLARLPDGGKGTKGISLFMVPRNLPDENGEAGVANALKVVSLEHKLGIHGSPTAVMQYDGATGWLIGQEHDGMKCMFTMMNNARLGVGMQGVGVAEAAYQQALEYAQERKQGRTPVADGSGAIFEHADVRRMLATMKSEIFAARAIGLECALALDMAQATGAENWRARGAFLTPIAKAFGTDVGIRTADTGVQVHGGMGFIEETGAAQYLRDVRITSIYEGTNGIQAMDLVARKMMDGGEMAQTLIDEVEQFAETARASRPRMAEAVWQASETLREATEWMVSQTDLNDRFAGCVPYLAGFARILGAHYHLKAAGAEGGEGPRTRLARFYIRRLLPEHEGLLAHAKAGQGDIYALSAEDLGV
ncbi:acyl-CoA dehydrogenase [Cognatishimia sp. SS12]|uniref:acyl-CoA dehydrogenase n=1 Tax=Cognatishimia sp. SS12 TaxID=2979465 RepID=UPI00232CEA53|nr:acyl-CoA dehydrogenase [Cognatishimia sp. SS12]MDC0739091.1 acyl-CoA dehydrogenase [Cognatishimia sp. SS12]